MDFYSAMAQVLPVLLLAIVWESKYLDRLKTESRPSRAANGERAWFWTKRRVRAYACFITTIITLAIGVNALVLANGLPDTRGLRIAVIASLALTLGTLITRLWVDIFDATKDR